MGRVRGCLSRIGCLTLLVLGTTVGWLYRAEIEGWWEELRAGPTAVEDGASTAERIAPEDGRFGLVGDSTAAAAGAADGADTPSGDGAARGGGGDGPASDAQPSEAAGSAVDRFLAATPPATIRLDADELADLLARRVEPGLPEGIARPAAVPGDSTLTIEADVDIRRTVGDRLPAMLGRMVGDSARVRARVVPSVPSHGVLRLRVREVRAGSVGLPVMTFPWLLSELGLPLAPNDPTAVDLQVGADLAAASVEDGELVLVRRAVARTIE